MSRVKPSPVVEAGWCSGVTLFVLLIRLPFINAERHSDLCIKTNKNLRKFATVHTPVLLLRVCKSSFCLIVAVLSAESSVLSSLMGSRPLAPVSFRNFTIRFMPIPIIDASQALKASPEKTEDALLKVRARALGPLCPF